MPARAEASDRLPIDLPEARVLRRLRVEDLAAFQAYRAEPELGRYQGWVPMSDADAAGFIARMQDAPLFQPGEWCQLGIADSDGRLIGDIGLCLAEDAGHVEIGFTLASAWQGRGIASAAVRAAVALSFAATPVPFLLAVADERNAASLRLLARLGFREIGQRPSESHGEACVERVHVLERDLA